MAKKKQRKPPKPWSMHPLKHPEVSRLLEDDNLSFTFQNNDDESGWTKTYDSSIIGRFICHNPNCATDGWSSKQVAITIRMYPKQKYNARVYHQRCERCNSLSKPKLDDTYAERVAYRIKKWCGIKLEMRPYSGKSKGPHKNELCEGCKAGHCAQSSGF
ncbi:zinc-binding domain-containing protein [Xylariaceae sp. AK1471]|nr:zinc-binding domain-containing protein [Xylariaceae sp. AK1471]